MESLLAVITGIGLSAACGFRVFVPLLALNLASTHGYLTLAPGFEWIGGYYATIAFASATILEIIAYYVPWLDHIMDAIASPASIIAGTIATASVITDLPPSVKWIVAIIAGGGIAGILQGTTTALRGKSSIFTGGLGNPLIATAELAGSAFIALLAIIIPIIGFVLAATFAIFALYKVSRIFSTNMKGK
ncbi:MAG TPA: DUF4126 domain-containing protein [Syntrophaceae bacterium]|jgi:hypothetical protein|nr:DUF4126 domain-containing protein [Syntrophaceae bacterium]